MSNPSLSPVAHLHSFSDIPEAPQNESRDAQNHLHTYGSEMHEKYGPIFIVKFDDQPVVYVADAEAITDIHESEGEYPIHYSPPAWKYYLEESGKKRGIHFMNGPAWLQYREILNQILLKSNSMKNHVEPISAICKDLVNSWLTNPPKSDLKRQLYNWNVECFGMMALGLRLGFSKNLLKPEFNSNQEKFISALQETFVQNSKMFFLKPENAKVTHKETWDLFCTSMKDSLELGHHYVRKGIDACSSDNERKHVKNSVLYQLLQNQGVDEEMAARLVVDLMITSADNVTHAASFMLYLLGKNPDAAQKAREQIFALNKEPLDLSTLHKYTYIKGIVKETMRLYPIAPCLTATLAKDIVINGYKIPANTMVASSLYTMGRNADYYEDPLSFKPERWFEAQTCENADKAYAPWGLGKRSCIGKQTAELELSCLVIHALSSFEWTVDQDIEPIMEMVMVPAEIPILNLKPI